MWHAIVDDRTGRLISTGTVVAERLPAGVAAIPLEAPPSGDQEWDEAARAFKPRAAPIRSPDEQSRDALVAKPVWDAADVASALRLLLAQARF